MVVVVPPADAAATTDHDGHEDHSQEAENDGGQHQPQRGSPVGGIVEVCRWADLRLPNEDDREVDPEDDESEEHGEDGSDEGEDAHRVGLEEEGREDANERESRRDEVEDEDGGDSIRDVVNERGIPRQVQDVFWDGVSQHREALARIEVAGRADAPYAETQVRRDGRDGLVGICRELEFEEVYSLDKGEREADKEEEHERCEKECARRERGLEVPRERARVPSPLRPVLTVVPRSEAAHGAGCAGGRVKERGRRRARWES